MNSFISWWIHWFIYCSSGWLIYSLILSLNHWFLGLYTHSYSFLDVLNPSFIGSSFIGSLVHSFIGWFILFSDFCIDYLIHLFWQPFAHSFDAPRNPNLSLILHPTDILLETRLFFETSAKALPRSTWYSYIILSLYNIARANVRAYA